jgi:MFS family permease
MNRRTNLPGRLDRLPWGRFHTVVTIALGLGWTLDAFETNIIGSVLGQVTKLWHLSAVQGSYLVSSWVVGVFVGALVFGYYSDRKGRKKMFIFTLIWYAAFSAITAFSWDFYSLLFLRFLTALAVGGEYSAVTAAMVEFIPQKHRGKTAALILAGFPLGAGISALTAMFVLNHLPAAIGWRVGFGVGGVLALLGLWVRHAIPESPRWLLTHGRASEAETIVEEVERALAAEKGIVLRPVTAFVNLGAEPPSFRQQLKELGSRYRGRLALACSLNFAQASVVYGIMSLLSLIILPQVKVPTEQMPFFYLVGNGGALAGGLLAALALDSLGRKTTVLVGYVLTTLATVCLYFAATPTAVLLAYTLVQFSVIGASNSAYIVISEIMPVRSRATGLGISVAAGRIGAFSAPILLSNIFLATGRPELALLALTAMTLPGPVAALVWYFKGIEGKTHSLEEVSNEAA